MTIKSQTRVAKKTRFQTTNAGTISNVDTLTSTKTWTGESLAHWRSRIRRGISATTAFTAEMTQYASGPDCFYCGSANVLRNNPLNLPPQYTYLEGFWMRHSSIANPSNLSETTANNQAMQRFVSRLLSEQRSFQGGVFIGELKEALHMIHNPAKALRNGFDDYLKHVQKRASGLSRISGALRVSKTHAKPKRTALLRDKLSHKVIRRGGSREANLSSVMADTWLEHAFGWRPLLADINDGAKALARINCIEYPRVVRISGRGEESSSSEASGSSFAVGETRFSSRERTVLTCQVQYVGGMKVHAPNASPLSELGLMPEDFIPTVWELIPWSFAVDYFTNVGNILDGYRVTRADLSWCSKTVRKLAVKTSVQPMGWPTPAASQVNVFHSFSPGRPVTTRKTINRSKYLGTFVPSLEFEIPGISTKWINLAALSKRSRDASSSLRGLAR